MKFSCSTCHLDSAAIRLNGEFSVNPTNRARLRERRIVLKNWNRLSNQATRRIIPTACATALTVAFAVSLPAHAEKVTPPPVPFNLQVEAGSHAFLVGHAIGTQNYVCAPSTTSNTGVAYVLFTPEATLFNDDGDQLITHFFSPNPDPSDPNKSAAVVADGAIRATWVHSRDGSSVWAKVHTDDHGVSATFTPDKTAVAWVLLDKVGVEDGLTGGNILSKTTQVQRLSTAGGNAPDHGCDSLADVGHTAFSNYTADYFFYTDQ
jgi:uncharacterized protein DUF3455